MFCTQCGEENRNDRKFCTNCGAKLKDYTKPVENTIMPEEIVFEQEKVKEKNSVARIFNVVLGILLVLAIGFTIASFFAQNTLRQVFSVVCISLFVVFLIGNVTKSIVIKKIDKKKSK